MHPAMFSRNSPLLSALQIIHIMLEIECERIDCNYAATGEIIGQDYSQTKSYINRIDNMYKKSNKQVIRPVTDRQNAKLPDFCEPIRDKLPVIRGKNRKPIESAAYAAGMPEEFAKACMPSNLLKQPDYADVLRKYSDAARLSLIPFELIKHGRHYFLPGNIPVIGISKNQSQTFPFHLLPEKHIIVSNENNTLAFPQAAVLLPPDIEVKDLITNATADFLGDICNESDSLYFFRQGEPLMKLPLGRQ